MKALDLQEESDVILKYWLRGVLIYQYLAMERLAFIWCLANVYKNGHQWLTVIRWEVLRYIVLARLHVCNVHPSRKPSVEHSDASWMQLCMRLVIAPIDYSALSTPIYQKKRFEIADKNRECGIRVKDGKSSFNPFYPQTTLKCMGLSGAKALR